MSYRLKINCIQRGVESNPSGQRKVSVSSEHLERPSHSGLILSARRSSFTFNFHLAYTAKALSVSGSLPTTFND
jgi:hypothetical protein